jgi:hypothetical protein
LGGHSAIGASIGDKLIKDGYDALKALIGELSPRRAHR